MVPMLPPLPEPSKDFVSPGDLQTKDFSKPLTKNGKRQMLHTPFVGACTICNITGSVDVDPMDFKSLERVLEGRVIKVVCPRCRKETEFRPLRPEEIVEDQFWLLKRQLEIKDLIFRRASERGVSVPDHVKGAVDEYMKRLENKLGKSIRLDEPAPGEIVTEEKKIIVPE
jgi:hypothetical protein